MAKAGGEDEKPIIIKKVIKKGGGHHGGAWKVAYADFVTAMMAFFLLLWLLNVSTAEQLEAVSSYFDPSSPRISSSESGAGGVLGGLSMSSKGAMASKTAPFVRERLNTHKKQGNDSIEGEIKDGEPSGEDPDKELGGNGEVKDNNTEETDENSVNDTGFHGEEKEEQNRFNAAAADIKQAIETVPELKQFMANIMVDMTPEGLRIQIVDQKGESMFPSGSARMFEKTQKLIDKISEVVKDLPNEISIRGHTDSIPYGKGVEYTNWELSTDRANSCRRAMMESGMPERRINNVVGKSDKEPLLKDAPADPRNRRISIVILKDSIVNKKKKNTPEQVPKPLKELVPEPNYKKTDGEVYFP